MSNNHHTQRNNNFSAVVCKRAGTSIDTCMYTHAHTFTRMHTHTHACTHTYKHAQSHTHMLEGAHHSTRHHCEVPRWSGARASDALSNARVQPAGVQLVVHDLWALHGKHVACITHALAYDGEPLHSVAMMSITHALAYDGEPRRRRMSQCVCVCVACSAGNESGSACSLI